MYPSQANFQQPSSSPFCSLPPRPSHDIWPVPQVTPTVWERVSVNLARCVPEPVTATNAKVVTRCFSK